MIPDNYEILRRHEERMEQERLKYPKCCYCDERICDDDLYEIDNGLYHEGCMKELFRKSTDNYILEDEE